MKIFKYMFLLAIFAAFAVPTPAPAVDWAAAPAAPLVMFYPGVTSWEFLNSDDHRLGGRDIKRRRKDCRHCHLSREGELDLKADEIVAGRIKMKRSHKPFEPEPVPGKKGVLTASVKAAYDGDYLYLRIAWPSTGRAWKASEADGEVLPDRVSVQMNSGEKTFRKYGCFVTCHNDVSSMPGAPAPDVVASNPYYGKLGRKDVRLYAFYARDGWKRPAEGLADIRKDGGLLDLISAEISRGSAKAYDGWIFDDRRWEEDEVDVSVEAEWSGGEYTVVFKRRLRGGNSHDLAIKEGDVIHADVSIHDDGTEKRKHYVSFPFSIGLGASADIEAVKIGE